jgi:N-acetylglucosamine repressor
MNLSQVFTALQKHGPLSRAEITRITGISGPTVTRAVSSLIESRLLEEGAFQQSAIGRPGKVVRLATTSVAVLAAVVGAAECELARYGLDGELHADSQVSFATPDSYPALVKTFARHARQLIARAQNHAETKVLRLGVSVPGLHDCRDGRTLVSPNVPQTNGQRLGHDLGDAIGLPTTVLQECSALCLAEQVYGAARESADFAMLDISEGLGLGVVQRGHLLEGNSGLAGELGHITVDLHGKQCGCGNYGCLETVATDTALAATLSQKIGRKLLAAEAVELVRSGAIEADAEVTQVLEYLAVALAAVINIFNPSQCFIYGRVLDAAPDAFDRLLAFTHRRALAPSLAQCQIIRARGNKRLGAVAAAIQSLSDASR